MRLYVRHLLNFNGCAETKLESAGSQKFAKTYVGGVLFKLLVYWKS